MKKQLNGNIISNWLFLLSFNESLLFNPKNDNALANKGEALNRLERYGEVVDWLFYSLKFIIYSLN